MDDTRTNPARDRATLTSRRYPCVALAGNPNTGKTTLFNQLTGSRARIGNYPGTTVDRHTGRMDLPGAGTVEVLDIPGTYSLSARSAEEQVAICAIAGLPPHDTPEVVVVVADAANLVRNLYLALQVIELGVPAVIALNMVDRLPETAQEVDAGALARELGVPVVAVVAQKGRGTEELKRAVDRVLEKPERGRPDDSRTPAYESLLEADMRAVGPEIPADWVRDDPRRRDAFALWALLSIDDEDELEGIPAELRARVANRHRLAEASSRSIEEEVIRSRYEWLDARAPAFLRESGAPVTRTDRIDRFLLHPALGFPAFLLLMTVVFQSLFAWADPMIGWIEALFGWLGGVVEGTLPAGVLTDLVVNGLIAGVGSVLVFLPQILLLFLFIGLMEDTGYMARVAYLMDRVMKALGLHGRAFVPMLSGFACAVPAILATRTMERRRDRFLTMMVVPLMTCSARLPVYGLLIAALLPAGEGRPMVQGLLLAGMYLFSTLVALVAAGVLGRTILPGKRTPLLTEMPPYRTPHLPSVLRMMWERSAVFIREAGTVILACTVGMWALLSFPGDAERDRRYDEQRAAASIELEGEALEARLATLDDEAAGEHLRMSYGGRLGRALEPVIEPLGFDWKIGVGLIGAFAAREVFVSTMAVVYGLNAESDEDSRALRDRVRSQRRPDGRPVYTPLVCFSLMVFFALACQCMSTLSVIKRETRSWRWPAFAFGYMTVLAWMASLVVYQGGRLLGFG